MTDITSRGIEDCRTSEEWQKLCLVKVVDPDGWNRKNFEYSWGEELITRAEFERRLLFSTCRYNAELWSESKCQFEGIWVDLGTAGYNYEKGNMPIKLEADVEKILLEYPMPGRTARIIELVRNSERDRLRMIYDAMGCVHEHGSPNHKFYNDVLMGFMGGPS